MLVLAARTITKCITPIITEDLVDCQSKLLIRRLWHLQQSGPQLQNAEPRQWFLLVLLACVECRCPIECLSSTLECVVVDATVVDAVAADGGQDVAVVAGCVGAVVGCRIRFAANKRLPALRLSRLFQATTERKLRQCCCCEYCCFCCCCCFRWSMTRVALHLHFILKLCDFIQDNDCCCFCNDVDLPVNIQNQSKQSLYVFIFIFYFFAAPTICFIKSLCSVFI